MSTQFLWCSGVVPKKCTAVVIIAVPFGNQCDHRDDPEPANPHGDDGTKLHRICHARGGVCGGDPPSAYPRHDCKEDRTCTKHLLLHMQDGILWTWARPQGTDRSCTSRTAIIRVYSMVRKAAPFVTVRAYMSSIGSIIQKAAIFNYLSKPRNRPIKKTMTAITSSLPIHITRMKAILVNGVISGLT